MPQIGDLTERLHFSPDDGRIWLDNRRMLLIDSYSMGALRIELIEAFGIETARGLLTRMGYTCGTRDAQLAMKVRSKQDDIMDLFLAGPQLHALEGIVIVEPVKLEIDVTKGKFYGEFVWRDSSEGEVHINNYGIGSEPVCWMQTGYASGYASVTMGRPILFREVQCSALGHETCRVIGKPASEWENPENDLKYFKPQPFVNKKVEEMEPVTVRKSSLPLTPKERVPDEYTPDVNALPGKEEIDSPYTEMVGVSARFSAACHMLSRVAPTNATVLFLGETGVGKEMFARTLYRISNRADAPFVAVNCAAIPENLIESELFGVEKGAFTGAVTSRPGRFELANNGTIFLDEAGTLSLASQGKLLRALQEKEIERVGSTTTKRINVRVIAATNVDLHKEVSEGRFREDLFFRLNVFPIRIPPLRERRDDIPLLMDSFLKRFIKIHMKNVTGFTSKAVEALLSYDWPGNIRELENVIERGVIMAPENGSIDLCHLFTYGEKMTSSVFRLDEEGSLRQKKGNGSERTSIEEEHIQDIASRFIGSSLSLDEMEDILVDNAMKAAGNNVSNAAKLLRITRARLDYRLKKRTEKSQG
ncbi:AAA family ATPase [Emcibacter nanhaiensis]|uniref:AAA family ATPase n=1 Tax=Emcibacter nanhaiensis TaxID=1505037 RepID=A0A501PL08_9PROT|nr:AAA family ATPase [Emcibacter nanhaiensis]